MAFRLLLPDERSYNDLIAYVHRLTHSLAVVQTALRKEKLVFIDFILLVYVCSLSISIRHSSRVRIRHHVLNVNIVSIRGQASLRRYGSQLARLGEGPLR